MTTILDLDALLDGTLDDVKNVPDYVTPPAGTYMLSISDVELDKRKNKDDDDVVTINITYVVAATIETKEAPVADGSMFSERFQYSEDGLAYFKRAAKNILNVADLDKVSLRDIFATLKTNAPFQAIISHTESVVGTGETAKKYTNLRLRPVHPVTA